MNPIYETLEYDANNIDVTKRRLGQYGVLPLLERVPGLFEALEAEIHGHLRQKTLPYLERRKEQDTTDADFTFQFSIFMYQLAKNQFLYATGHLLRGHTVEVFPHLRSMIESAGYARLALAEPGLAELYFDDDKKTFKKRTPSNRLFPIGTPISEALKRLYDSCSELTHNNLRTLALRHKLGYETDDGQFEFSSAVFFHDAEDDALEYALQRGLYITYASHRVLSLFTQVFEFPDSVIHRRLDHFEVDRLTLVKAFNKKFLSKVPT